MIVDNHDDNITVGNNDKRKEMIAASSEFFKKLTHAMEDIDPRLQLKIPVR
jgi:hypothetical protein